MANLHNQLATINYHDNIVSEIKIYTMKFLGRFGGSFRIYVQKINVYNLTYKKNQSNSIILELYIIF
jgi:hypothetical protein